MAAGDTSRRTMRLTLDVALVPMFVAPDPVLRARTTYVVVDVIRATTTLAVMLGYGCRRVLVAPGIAEARAVAQPEPGRYLLGGESGGVAPPGFDFGNSPREYAAADLAGREIIFATTNGTRALRACTGGYAIYAGSLRNARAVARAAVASAIAARRHTPDVPGTSGADEQDPHAADEGLQATADVPRPFMARSVTTGTPSESTPGVSPEASRGASEAALADDDDGQCDIVVVCAGREGLPSYDDTLCAGYLIGRIEAEAATRDLGVMMESGARIALDASRYVMQQPDGLRAALGASGAGRAIRAVGLEADLDWCAAIDATDVVPYVAAVDAERDLLALRPYAGASRGDRRAPGA